MKNIVLIIFFLTFLTNIKAQEDNEGLTPVSLPNQFGNISVNMATGAPNYEIPVWTAKSGSLSLPVCLIYSTNGIRVQEMPSEVGLGWELTVGGEIYQITRGVNDFVDCDIPQNNCEDTEPDIFIYNINGMSGQFNYNQDDGVFKFDDNKVVIEFDDYKFVITDERGIQYFFEKRESESWITYEWYYDHYNFDRPVSSSGTNKWLLTKIKSLVNNDEIIINYIIENEYNHADSYDCGMFITTEFLDEHISYNEAQKRYALRKVGRYKLSDIQTNNEIINFDISVIEEQSINPYNPYFDDMYNDPQVTLMKDKVLKTVEIHDTKGNLIKKNNFRYEYSNQGRFFLKEISEINPENTNDSLPPYRFFYSSDNDICHIKSEYYDFWGYAHSALEDNEHLYEHSNRFSDPPEAIKGLLTEIHFPQGGYTKYEYEPNTYYFPDAGNWYSENWDNVLTENGFSDRTNLTGPGFRVKKVIYNDGFGNNYIDEYGYSDNGVSSGRLSYYPQLIGFKLHFNKYYFPSNSYGLEQGNINYKKITVYKGGKVQSGSSGYRGLNGKTEYNLSSFPPAENDENNLPYNLQVFQKEFNGLLENKIIYNNENNFISEIVSNYAKEYIYDFLQGSKTLINNGTGYYKIYRKSIRLNQRKEKNYASNNSGIFSENTSNYEYERSENAFKYSNPTKIKQTLSESNLIETYLYYPEDFTGDNGVYDEMTARNILSTVVKKEVFNNGIQISGERTLFRIETIGDISSIVRDQLQIWENGTYKTLTWFDKYNDNAKLIQSHGIDEVYNSVITGYNNTLPIATAINAREGEIFHDDFEELETDYSTDSYTGKYSKLISGNQYAGVHDFNMDELVSDEYTYSAWFNTNSEGVKLIVKDWSGKGPWEAYTIPNTNGEWEYHEFTVNKDGFSEQKIRCEIWANGHEALVDNVRFFPADAQMATTTYKPLTGKTSETDANGKSVYYEYDDYGRLVKNYNQDKYLIEEKFYNIPPVTEDLSFNITADFTGSFLSGCQDVTLTIDNVSPQDIEDVDTWQWFDDYCGGNIIEDGDTFVNYSPTSTNKTIYARPVVNGHCVPCESYTFHNLISGTFTIPENTPSSYEIVEENGLTVEIPYSYDACDGVPVPIILFNDDYDWFHIYPQQNSYLFVCDELQEEFDGFQRIDVKWGSKNFTFRRVEELTADIFVTQWARVFDNQGELCMKYRIKCNGSGGRNFYQYSWDGGQTYSSYNEYPGLPPSTITVYSGNTTTISCAVRSGTQTTTVSITLSGDL